MQVQLVFVLLMTLILVVFTFQNPFPVQMQFMGWRSGQIPMVVIILISMLVGVIMSLLLGLKNSREMKKTINQLKDEIDELRTPPVSPGEQEPGQ